MIPVDFDGRRKTNWVLTAEIAGGRKALMPKTIVDGLKNEVGAHQTGDIGKEVFILLVCLSIPRQSSPNATLTDSSCFIEKLGTISI
jgi:hypothetical protein